MFNSLFFLKIIWFYLNILFSISDRQNDKKNKEENKMKAEMSD